MELGRIAELLTFFVALVGFVLSFFEYKRSNKIKRSSYIEPLINKMKSDKDICGMVYMLQYGKFVYTENFHDGGELERKLDKTLQYFSYLCYLKDKHIISSEEFSFFELEISQALRDEDLINYLYNLFHFVCKVQGYNHTKSDLKKSIYGYLLYYAQNKRLIDNSFFDTNEVKYPHYLNF